MLYGGNSFALMVGWDIQDGAGISDLLLVMWEVGCNISYPNLGPVLQAVSLRSEGVSRLLLDYGADVDAKGTYRYTGLHIAAKSRHETVVELLLKNGAKVDEKDRSGYTALHLAAYSGNKTVVPWLLKSKASFDTKTQ